MSVRTHRVFSSEGETNGDWQFSGLLPLPAGLVRVRFVLEKDSTAPEPGEDRLDRVQVLYCSQGEWCLYKVVKKPSMHV